jgi:hypothetical protein
MQRVLSVFTAAARFHRTALLLKKLIGVRICCSLMFLVPTVTYGISAQWDLAPISADWNTSTYSDGNGNRDRNKQPDFNPEGDSGSACGGRR